MCYKIVHLLNKYILQKLAEAIQKIERNILIKFVEKN